ncbi:MAG: hypothetical protein QM503_03815 [Bacteroidota bacterium]
MSQMFNNFFKLFSGISLGSFATIINVNQTQVQELVSFHVSMINNFLGLVIGVFTLIFLIYQIKKIRRDLKQKKTP